MASAHALVHSLLFLVLKTRLSLAATTKGSSPHRIVTRLIHRDSLLSPYYHPKDTITDRAARILQTSTARLAYFEAKVLETNVHQLNLVPSFPELLVNFSLGDPPIRQLAVMDTGSNLLWVRCAPCRNCRGQTTPMLDPLRSSTYSSVSCRTSYCSYAPRSKCDRSDWCIYNQTYYDGPSSRGVLSKDQLTFETWDDGGITVPDVVFGCGHDNGRFKDGRITGILGLGARMISLVSRLGSQFSYCIGNLMDPSYAYNHLILGEGAIFEGYSTPLEVVEGLYYVTLEGISIGQKRLDIDRNAFRRTRRYDGVVIDSGSPMTWLVEGAAQAVHGEVKSLLDGVLERVPNGPSPPSSPLCYQGTVGRDLIGFPVMTLHFADGADLGLDAASMFYQARDDMFCVAVVRSDVEGLSIVGLMAQQYYNMAFDVAGKKLSFQRIDCALLDE